MKNQTSRSHQLRRGMVLGLSVMAASTGCASMKSPTTWFSKAPATAAPTTSMASSLSSTGSGISGQFKSMGTAVSSAVGKAKSAVTSTFTSRPEESDPTSLANMPTNLGPEIWVTNGQLFESQGQFAKALDNYTKALEVEPNNEPALLSTARLYARQNQHDQAAEFFAKSIAVNPDAATFNELGLVQKKQGRPAESQASIEQAIKLDPTNVRYRNNLASMLVGVGRSDDAVRQLEQVLPPAVANYNVAYLHFTNSNVAAAQQHLQLALQADPNLKEARDLLDRIGGSPTAQTAMAAYQTAGQIYRTAQAVNGSATPASSAVYQQPPANVTPAAQAAQPSYPTSGYPVGQ